MEGNSNSNRPGNGTISYSSSSSFTADLFGTKESSPPNSGGAFASMFPPPSRDHAVKNSGTQAWSDSKKITSAGMNGEAASYRNLMLKEDRMEPCHLSSSIYYGGQENYSHSSSGQSAAGLYPLYKKDGGDDNNSNSASRGNWWQGSLYY